MTAKHSINLLQAELFPERSLLTLSRVVATWLGLLFIMVIWSVITEVNFSKSAKQYDGLLKEKQSKTQFVKSLATELKNRSVSPAFNKEARYFKASHAT